MEIERKTNIETGKIISILSPGINTIALDVEKNLHSILVDWWYVKMFKYIINPNIFISANRISHMWKGRKLYFSFYVFLGSIIDINLRDVQNFKWSTRFTDIFISLTMYYKFV